MRLFSLFFLVVTLATLSGCGDRSARKRAKSGAITLKDATVVEVEKAIADQKGKVVIVDCWGYFCPPCKAEFPKLVSLHERLASKGLVCMSVSLDDERDKDSALAFLEKHDATFPNFWLPAKENDEFSAKWDIQYVPTVFVYGRDGKQYPFREGTTYEALEPMIQELLAQ